MTNQELREQLKAKFTDELSSLININAQGKRIKSWRVAFETESREVEFFDCEDIYEHDLNDFINEIMSEGLIYLQIESKPVSVYPLEEESK